MLKGLQIARLIPFLTLAALALAYEPLSSDFKITLQGCEMVPTGSQFAATFANTRHLGSFFVLFLLAAVAFRHRPLLKAAIATFVLSLCIELIQAVVARGHCRSWDLIPNIMAITSGGTVAFAVGAAWHRVRARHRT